MLNYIAHISSEIIPVFLLAVLFSSLIDFYLPEDFFAKSINSENNISNLFLAALLGSLVPICTCGMIPLAIKLNKKGLRWTYLIAFLTAGNANSIPAMILTTTLNYQLVFYRLLVSVIFGVLVAYLLEKLTRKDYSLELGGHSCHQEDCCGDKSFIKKLVADLKELSLSFLPWIFLAIFLAALMHYYVGVDTAVQEFILPFRGNIISPLVMSLVGFPFYFCAGADVPLAKEFLDMAFPMGSVLVFMLAAPGINLTSFFVYKKAVGMKAALIYTLASILVITVLGVLINYSY